MKGKWRLVLLLWMLCCFCTASFAEDESQKERIIFEENQPGGIKQGVRDGDGNIIVPAKYDEIAGFAGMYSRVEIDNMVGLIDIDGNEIAPCIYEDITIPEDGYFVVLYYSEEETTTTYEYFYLDGTPTGWKFEHARGFHDSYAMVISKEKDYLLDTTGKLHSIEPYELTYGDGFSEGRLLVSKDGRYGYLDTSLELVIPCIYDDASAYFWDGVAEVRKGDVTMYIDRDGNIVDDIDETQ